MRLAFVGLGKMGRSILKGALERGFLRPEEVGVLGRTPERSRELAEPFGVRPLTRADLGMAERVLIAVQPRDFPALAPEIAHHRLGYISIMAGISTSVLARRLDNRRVVRAMPNLAVAIGESSTALTALKEAREAEDLAFARALFATVGDVYEIPEHLFDAFTGMSASAPAYLAVVAEALADAGVKMGMPRALALRLAADALAATGELLKGRHPAQVKDEVASPGGTTIHGLHALGPGRCGRPFTRRWRRPPRGGTSSASRSEATPCGLAPAWGPRQKAWVGILGGRRANKAGKKGMGVVARLLGLGLLLGLAWAQILPSEGGGLYVYSDGTVQAARAVEGGYRLAYRRDGKVFREDRLRFGAEGIYLEGSRSPRGSSPSPRPCSSTRRGLSRALFGRGTPASRSSGWPWRSGWRGWRGLGCPRGASTPTACGWPSPRSGAGPT